MLSGEEDHRLTTEFDFGGGAVIDFEPDYLQGRKKSLRDH